MGSMPAMRWPRGTTIHVVTDVPASPYVVPAPCGRDGGSPSMWVSAYPVSRVARICYFDSASTWKAHKDMCGHRR